MNRIAIFFLVVALPLVSHAADQRINNQMVQELAEYFYNDKGWSPLNYAIEMEDYESALIICDYTGDIRTTDDGFNALNRIFNIAIKKHEKLNETARKIGDKLLDRGIDIHWIPPRGASPNISCSSLVYACQLGLEDLVVRFLDRKVNVNQSDELPLATAIQAGHLNIVRLLINRGADVNKGALRVGVGAQNYEAIDVLIQAGANINQSDLLKLAITQHIRLGGYLRGLPMLRFLLERGANPNPKNSVLETALSIPTDTEAQQTYKTEVVKLLLQYGAVL